MSYVKITNFAIKDSTNDVIRGTEHDDEYNAIAVAIGLNALKGANSDITSLSGLTTALSITQGGTDATTASGARTNLGVTGTGVDTTYNYRANNLSDIANASTARTNLGLAIGTNVQEYNADLQGISQGGNSCFKNRIINGGMVIDQRNAGASITANNNVFCTDRFKFQASQTAKGTLQQSTTAPTGFINSLLFTSSSAYSITSTDFFVHTINIEGLNVADLAWGTASAATVTFSFWVRSSLTGTFGGVVQNNASDRSYPFTYTISSANTWEQKSITIAGDTSGTWLTTNGVGIRIYIGLGVGSTFNGTAGAWAGANYIGATGATSVVGTNGATFYITGVQLEKGSTATSFDYRPYGTELALCQRYYYRLTAGSAFADLGNGWNSSTTTAYALTNFPVPMRTFPTALEQSGTAGDYRVLYVATTATCTAVPTYTYAGINYARTQFTVAAVLTLGQGSSASATVTTAYLAWSAEL